MPEPRLLITSLEAAVWTGRPVSTIRRWASEGRMTRYGEGRGNVRYDVRELPAKTIGPDGEVVPGSVPGPRDVSA
jgi:hypothetical protein